jgi:PAS domain S-box-containing protein
MPYLIYRDHNNQKKTYKLKLGANTFGRATDNMIPIHDMSVSRYHGIIEVSESMIFVKDLQSSNGTFVNSIKIEKAPLQDNDLITIGQVNCQFRQSLVNQNTSVEIQSDSIDFRKILEELPIEIPVLDFKQTTIEPQPESYSVLKFGNLDDNELSLHKLNILLEVSKKLSSLEELDLVLNTILELLFDIIYLDRAVILLADENTGKLEKKAVESREFVPKKGQFYSSKIVEWVYENGEVMATANATQDERFQDSSSVLAQNIGASLCVPFKPRDSVIGVLYIDNLDFVGIYSQDDIEFVTALANQAAIAIYNAQLYTKLKENERRVSQFLEAMPVAVSVHEPSGNIYYVNQIGQKLLGIDTLVSKETKELSASYNLYQAETDNLYPIEEIPIVRSLQGETVTKDDLEIHQENNYIPIEMVSTPIYAETGEIEYAIAAFQDITERKEAEKILKNYNEVLQQQVEKRTKELSDALEELKLTQKQLVESEKMASLGGLVAGIAHEINTPVGVGVIAASTLADNINEIFDCYKNGTMKRSQLHQFLDTASMSIKMVLTNLQRAADLIQSFKQVAVDQSTEGKRSFNLKKYIEDLLLSLSPKIKHTKHKINVMGDNDITLNSYPGVISQIITNLFINSLTHAYKNRDDGLMFINIEKQNDKVILTYTDNGQGIPKENLDKIFEPFFTTNRGDGRTGSTGLGLHLVYNLVTQKLGGTIKCESELNIGTHFVITIPLSSHL